MRYTRTTQSTVVWLTTLVLASALLGLGSVPTASAASPRDHSLPFRHLLVGSWLVTYDVKEFGGPIPILLSCGHDGVLIETDSPAPTPVGDLGILILSNGHGAWVPKDGPGAFTYLYRKLIYQQDGFTPFGTTRTQAAGTVSADGTQFQATLVIEFLDTEGAVKLSVTGLATGTRIHVDQP